MAGNFLKTVCLHTLSRYCLCTLTQWDVGERKLSPKAAGKTTWIFLS